MPPYIADDALAPNRAPAFRGAGREMLSLALIDSRNHTLQVAAHFEQAARLGHAIPCKPELELPLWLLGHVGWLAEYWIGRNPSRSLGAACPANSTRLAPIDPMADRWFDPALVPHDARWALELPGYDAV